MPPARSSIRAVLAACAAFVALASPAAASPRQESILMDDSELVYSSTERLERRLSEIKELGVDRIRVSVYWTLIAPTPQTRDRPSFGPGGPASPSGYPEEKWNRYDEIVRRAKEKGLKVLFSITAPAPLWATERQPNADVADIYRPSPADFRDFVTAVGTRYSGSYKDEQPAAPAPPAPRPPQQPPPLLPFLQPSSADGRSSDPGSAPSAAAAQAATEGLPRVDHWSIWNEPNHPGWLVPQSVGRVPSAPHFYRQLVDAGYSGLSDSGHGSDVILLGETAPRGLPKRGALRGLRPLEFVRELYCVDKGFRPLAGSEAQVRGCPSTPEGRQAFRADHPGLFNAVGWAHHPYALDLLPNQSDPEPDNATLKDTGRLVTALDRALGAYGSRHRPLIWLTEYGYQTKPPDPTIGVSWSKQAAFLNEGEFIAYRNPRVASFAQFLLVDDGPRRQYPAHDPRYWGSFQTGLVALGGRRKLAYDAFKRPIHVTPQIARKGRRVRVFGRLRSPGGTSVAKLQFRERRTRRWKSVRTIATANPLGYLDARVPLRASGFFRLAWQPAGTRGALVSRPVPVRVGRPPKPRRSPGRRGAPQPQGEAPRPGL